jgi:RNA polymerase sigma-70 factor, ECF subfamily
MTSPDATEFPDPDLPFIQLAQSGDLDAFDAIVLRHQSLIAAILHRFTKTPSDLEDLVQETFVKAWQALPDWRPDRPFLHWLKRIAVRTGLEYCRRQKRSPLAFAIDFTSAGPLMADEEKTDSQLALQEARSLLSYLPAEDQTLLTLLHLHGMTMDEIAAHFHWSRANAKIKAFRARHRLRKILTRHGYSAESA